MMLAGESYATSVIWLFFFDILLFLFHSKVQGGLLNVGKCSSKQPLAGYICDSY